MLMSEIQSLKSIAIPKMQKTLDQKILDQGTMSKGMMDKKIKKLEKQVSDMIKKEIGNRPIISGSS